MSPVVKGLVYGIAGAVIALILHLPDPLVIIVGGGAGVIGALD